MSVLKKALNNMTAQEVVELGSLVKQAGAYVLANKLREKPGYKECSTHAEVMAKFISQPQAAETVTASLEKWKKEQAASKANVSAAKAIARGIKAGARYDLNAFPEEMREAINAELAK